MEETYLVLMLKDEKTGFLEKELNAYKILENEDLIVNIFATKNDEKTLVHLRLSTDKDCLDWEFDAIYDYYDTEIFKDLIIELNEAEEVYNPTFELVFNYIDDDVEMENFIKKILNLHRLELNDVYDAIADKQGDYL